MKTQIRFAIAITSMSWTILYAEETAKPTTSPPDHQQSEASLRNSVQNPIHKTAEAWLADPLFKSLSSDIRIDYFCRQLILASCASEALKLIEAEKDTVKRGYLIAAVSDEWSKIDPVACSTWASGLKVKDHNECALAACVVNIARSGKNKELAVQLYDKIPSGQTKDVVLEVMKMNLGESKAMPVIPHAN